MAQQITYDKAYDTVAPEDFAAIVKAESISFRKLLFNPTVVPSGFQTGQ